MKRSINVRCYLAPQQSYGIVAFGYIEGLLRAGWNVRVVPYYTTLEPGSVKVPEYVTGQVGPMLPGVPSISFICTNGSMGADLNKGDILYTMWETSKVPPLWVNYINRAKALIVPGGDWGKQMYKASGVKIPIYSVPLGIDEKVFYPDTYNFPKGCIFTTAGRALSGQYRKGLERVILAFLYAFPTENDVVLRVKTAPDCPLNIVFSPKVQIVTSFLTPADLARFHQESLCYVSGATGEGWGLHQHEAMMCGKPLISVNWGGVSSFFQGNKHGIAVPYKMENVHDFFPEGNYGNWALAPIENLAKAMRLVYHNRLDVFLRGLQAYEDVKHLTRTHMQDKFNTLLETLI